jgi:hypothetical protein
MRRKRFVIHRSWRCLLFDLSVILVVCGTVGIALKFVYYLEKWVWFPLLPNVLDSAFLIAGACLLAFQVKRQQKKREDDGRASK